MSFWKKNWKIYFPPNRPILKTRVNYTERVIEVIDPLKIDTPLNGSGDTYRREGHPHNNTLTPYTSSKGSYIFNLFGDRETLNISEKPFPIVSTLLLTKFWMYP
jgi:hypothetical protein